MKFFHLSDLHIGVKLYNRDLSEDQRYVFERIAEYARAEQPDAIIIAGDIYDKAIPAAESVELFDGFVNALTQAAPEAEIMMISGNHDSAPRINVCGICARSVRGRGAGTDQKGGVHGAASGRCRRALQWYASRCRP